MTLMITGVAIKSGVNDLIYSVPRPGRHIHVVNLMRQQGVETSFDDVKGFILNDESFIDSVSARPIAAAAGQIIRDPSVSPIELFSDDMW